MTCFLPIKATYGPGGRMQITKDGGIHLPCGRCTGCAKDNARDWALRCHLEWQQHDHAVFATLTYRDETLPPTLEPRHLQLWLKRTRWALGTARSIRFFASGEYGEKNGRPHYHALLFGARHTDRDVLDNAWGLGHVNVQKVNTARINYIAGYTQKKWTDRAQAAVEQLDESTGEIFRYQPPFIRMSRRPGIGGHAREYTNSWRQYAVFNGVKVRVPRFLHEAWRKTATPEQIEQNRAEKRDHALRRDTSPERLEAAHTIEKRKTELRAQTRHV